MKKPTRNSNAPPSRFYPVKTRLGFFWVRLEKDGALTKLRFPEKFNASTETPGAALRPCLREIQSALDNYFSGKPIAPQMPLSPQGGTSFQRKVWKTLQSIPYGETCTYAWLARQVGSPQGVRAVGNACGKNPIPIFIPCHRIVGSNGSLGGFSSGLKWKKRLLALENKQKHVKIKKGEENS